MIHAKKLALIFPLVTGCSTMPTSTQDAQKIWNQGVNFSNGDVHHDNVTGLDFSKTSRKPINADEGNHCAESNELKKETINEIKNVATKTKEALADDGKVSMWERTKIKAAKISQNHTADNFQDATQQCVQAAAFKTASCKINDQNIVVKGKTQVKDVFACIGKSGVKTRTIALTLQEIEQGQYNEGGEKYNQTFKAMGLDF